MQPRVVVLGTGPIAIAPDVPREGRASIEELLATNPEAAVVAAEGRDAFFRASLAFERGVRRVILRRGTLSDAWLNELAARSAELGGELFVRGDDNRYERVRSRDRHEVGSPPDGSFSLTPIDATSAAAPMPLLEISSEERAVRCEELAFAIGLKPVLYLVVDRARVDAVIEQYRGRTIVEKSDRLASDHHSGERTYGVGQEVVHLFIGSEAARAAELWADGGSSRHVDELGALMGYPRCCVRAFHAMANRRVNAAFPYVTAARTRALGAPFSPLLDVTYARLVPFVPCTYGCREAIAWARAVARAANIERTARTVLYFDEARAIAFGEASIEGDRVSYRGAYWAAPSHDDRSAVLRRVYGAGFAHEGSFAITDDAVELSNGTAFSRAGGLGIVLPFA